MTVTNNAIEFESYWINYNFLAQPFMESRIEDIANGLTRITTPKMKSNADNYLAIKSQAGLEYLLQSNIPDKSFCLFPFESYTKNIEKLKNRLGENKIEDYFELWIRSLNYENLTNFNDLFKSLSLIKNDSYEFFVFTFENDLKEIKTPDIETFDKTKQYNYNDAFIEGFKIGGFNPPDSEYYVKAYSTKSAKPEISINLAIGIKEKFSNQIAACSFMLIGKGKTNQEMMAYLHGDTVVPQHTGNKLQKYLIEYRKLIAKEINIKAENIFALVSKDSPSHKNYIKNNFVSINENGARFICT